MATQLFCNLNDAPNLSAVGDWLLETARGSGVLSANVTSINGPTSGLQVAANWWYRVNAVTIAGAITKNIWASESAMTANAGPQVIIDRYDGAGTFISQVTNSEEGIECGTSRTAHNWATGTVTSTAFADGDYIRVGWYFNDAGGTMASGSTLSLGINGTTAAADGDSYVTFTETITEYVASAGRVPFSRPYPQLLAQ